MASVNGGSIMMKNRWKKDDAAGWGVLILIVVLQRLHYRPETQAAVPELEISRILD
jgi:hypothetical protein